MQCQPEITTTDELTNMTAIHYAHFDTRRLDDLLEQSQRTEIDFRKLLETWQEKLVERSDADVPPTPDPVAKRLRYLLADARRRRRTFELELTRQLPGDSDRRNEDKTAHPAEPTIAHDHMSASTRQTVPAGAA